MVDVDQAVIVSTMGVAIVHEASNTHEIVRGVLTETVVL
jgi:hypothetical protein